ncbi:MAG: hypothetical protein EP310_08155 [Bacteroidetes bacterium]|nr:MAG: hypothetical protein EP310_08155 [Bacteroidota bacterium]
MVYLALHKPLTSYPEAGSKNKTQNAKSHINRQKQIYWVSLPGGSLTRYFVPGPGRQARLNDSVGQASQSPMRS